MLGLVPSGTAHFCFWGCAPLHSSNTRHSGIEKNNCGPPNFRISSIWNSLRKHPMLICDFEFLLFEWIWEYMQGSAHHRFLNQYLLFEICLTIRTWKGLKILSSIWKADFDDFPISSIWNRWNTPEYLLFEKTLDNQPSRKKAKKLRVFSTFFSYERKCRLSKSSSSGGWLGRYFLTKLENLHLLRFPGCSHDLVSFPCKYHKNSVFWKFFK